jgi:hypothetical protein
MVRGAMGAKPVYWIDDELFVSPVLCRVAACEIIKKGAEAYTVAVVLEELA